MSSTKSSESALKTLIESGEFLNKFNLDRKTYGLVFDKRTLIAVYEVIKKYNIDMFDFPISSGKESVVFRVLSNRRPLVIKIYKMSTLKFSNTSDYILGDYRFEREKLNRVNIVYIWARKEYTNLSEMMSAGVSVPRPLGFYKNVLLMSYIGTKKSPAPQLRYVDNADFNDIFDAVLDNMKKMYRNAGLVHADLSDYNILYYRRKIYIIDTGQSVSIKHPMAHDFLKRDVNNICSFFSRKGIKKDPDIIFKSIVDG
ncbi:serine protein kinase RIO [Picrophilus oshimae]|uniref:non-specific serine/threonine protein kinase n=1 Tax=Picrophilus torridus (strain ATCC 700027 / DSM 9790 / JCM 10055 / NBRC 100828 / KAW 2/3) TaxID=1122961 RepID=Q6L2G5_PICTO|nr:serine protein kinase RIO [Picrophilus oshimae]AAT42837.1 serine/threonine protein kinase [Picrophilus oshimae DSM 9789]